MKIIAGADVLRAAFVVGVRLIVVYDQLLFTKQTLVDDALLTGLLCCVVFRFFVCFLLSFVLVFASVLFRLRGVCYYFVNV